jgi:hypothetical protein
MWEGCPCKSQTDVADDLIRHPNRIIIAWLQGEDIDDNDVVGFGASGETVTSPPVLLFRPPILQLGPERARRGPS